MLTKCLLFLIAINMALATYCAYDHTIVIDKRTDNLEWTFAMKNTKYVIIDNIDLAGKTVIIGDGSVLVFKGGSLANGTVVGNNTIVKARNYEIFRRGSTHYRAYRESSSKSSVRPSIMKEYRNSIILEGTWKNKKCGTNWTGLLNESDEDVMLSVKNYVILHLDGTIVKFPNFKALGYESTELPGNHIIDFNHSIISYPDDLNVWVDDTISLPVGATPCSIESGYGLISTKSNSTIANLSIDGKSSFRQDEVVRLGVSCIISIGNSKNVTFENVTLSNVLGPAMTAQSGARDIFFKNCRFNNIGEHVLYSHQYLGYCRFYGCTFDTWDSERISVYRNGIDYVYKYVPPVDGISFDELYNFELQFTDCSFINPKRINAQGRTLGGFLTGTFPLIVNITGCKFIGSQPPLNPGGGSSIYEESGKVNMMIVRECEGAPYVYPSKANYNIVSEFYHCKNIPFRTVYARRYEDCILYLDVYEEDIENVSPSFENEFSQPLVIKNCDFVDSGKVAKINHPAIHRPITFEGCNLTSNVIRKNVTDFITIKSNKSLKITYQSCRINLPGFLVKGERIESSYR